MPTPEDTPPLTPRQVFELIRESSIHRNIPVEDLYAPDGVHEWPFPLPGGPGRLNGREEIRAFYAAGHERHSEVEFHEFRNVVIHETTDPEVIIAEYDIPGRYTPTGESFVFSYILVLRVRDGKIIHLRDYLNPLAMTQVLTGATKHAESHGDGAPAAL